MAKAKVSRSDQALPLDAKVQVATINVVQEQATVSKRVVETGAVVRVRKVVHEEVVDIDVPLDAETFEAERVSIGRVIDTAAGVRQEGDVTIFPIVEERIVTHKELVLVEEIRVTRRQYVKHTPQKATVRREEAVVERRDSESEAWKKLDGNDPPEIRPSHAPRARGAK